MAPRPDGFIVLAAHEYFIKKIKILQSPDNVADWRRKRPAQNPHGAR
ncbi:hypothetical protein ABI_45680 [Asticcacaulis biprosthecium C19]|uniref:Uncharacterized protein n=1 Tax=Asticcacaulis biprosthecium C19 TaxID=715226 RepID=F4QTS1_9CAUL|nr:hypothetical protein ABI_45680 [Asticcacaulis biprosthecium C19]